MVKPWIQEVGDARSVIEPVVRDLDSSIEVSVSDGDGFINDTVEVSLAKAGRQAHCVVTFEAWVNARTSPDELKAAFRQIIADLEGSHTPSDYIVTSRGLATKPRDTNAEHLRDMAAAEEADALADQTLRRSKA
jgi:hypothetical protein